MLIIDDSVSSEWKVSSETVKKILKNKNKLSIVARHNIPIKELKDYVNSWAGVKTNFTLRESVQKTYEYIVAYTLVYIIARFGQHFVIQVKRQILLKIHHVNHIHIIRNKTLVYR